MKKIIASFFIEGAYSLLSGRNLNNSIFNLGLWMQLAKDLTSQNVEINDLKGGRPIRTGYCIDK
jgi:hypothetical protein